jgi:hypothetical protein
MLKHKLVIEDISHESWFKELKLTEDDIDELGYSINGTDSTQTEVFGSEGHLLIHDSKVFVIDYDWESYIVVELDMIKPERDMILALMQYTNNISDKAYNNGVARGKSDAKSELRSWLNN